MNRKKRIKPILAFIMALVTLMGASPVHLFAMAVDADAETETTPQYIYVDGERVSLDDERILNVVTVKPQTKPLQADIGLFAAAKDNSRALSVAKGNADRILGITPDAQTRRDSRAQTRHDSHEI